MALACTAAGDAGLPGTFRVWEQDGVLAVLVSDPGLDFLSTISGVTVDTVAAAIALAEDPCWQEVSPFLVLPDEVSAACEPSLWAADLWPTSERLTAVVRPTWMTSAASRTAESLSVVPAPPVTAGTQDPFTTVLLAGYQVHGPVAAFIDAEHRHPAVHRFLALERQTSIAAAGLTIHDGVAVLGGASTLPARRGRGAQSALLQHRLGIAADAGVGSAVATATPDSVSARNLVAAGFAIHRQVRWQHV